MCQNLPAHGAQSAETNWSQLLPGLQLTHTIYLVSGADMAVVATIATHLASERAPVRSWTVVRRNGVVDHKICLGHMGEQFASELREQLANIADVMRARVEHCFLRRGFNEEPPIDHLCKAPKALRQAR